MEDKRTRRLALNSVILTLRMLFTMMLSFYSSRLILQALGITSFGVYNVVCGVTAIITVIGNSLSEGINRFITIEVSTSDKYKINRIFAASNTALLGVSLLFFLLCETVGLLLFYNLTIPEDTRRDAFVVYQISIATMVVTFNGISYQALVQSYEKFGFFGLFSVTECLLRLAVTSLLFLLPKNSRLSFYGIGLLCVAVFLRMLIAVYIKRLLPFLKYGFSWNIKELKTLCVFTGYKLLWECSEACGTQGLNVLVNFFFGPVLNAARGIGFQVQSAIYKLLLNFQMPLRPQILKYYTIGDRMYFSRLLFFGTKISITAMLVFMLPIIVYCRHLLSWWLGQYPSEAIVITSLMCLESLICTSFLPLEAALDATGDIKKYKIFQSVVFFFVLPLSFLAYKMGLAYYYAFLVVIFLQLIVLLGRIVIICPKIGIGRFFFIKEVLLKMIVIVIGCSGLALFMKPFLDNSFLSFLCFVIVNSLFVLITAYVVFLNTEERSLVKGKIYSTINKRRG